MDLQVLHLVEYFFVGYDDDPSAPVTVERFVEVETVHAVLVDCLLRVLGAHFKLAIAVRERGHSGADSRRIGLVKLPSMLDGPR